jgi:FKBP-type peptidyl-prolyl cis-trans isomerase FkpA
MKRNHQFLLLSLVTILVVAFSSFTKGKDKGHKKQFAGYQKSTYNTYYLLHKKGTGTTAVDTGGAVFIKMKFKTPDDSVFLDINKSTQAPSYPMLVNKPLFKGDFLDFFLKLHVGDSVSFFVSMDSLQKYYPQEFHFEPQFDTMKYLGFAVQLDSTYSKAKVADLQAKIDAEKQKQMAEQQKQQAEQQKAMAIMKPIQDSARAKEPMLKENDFALLSEYIKTKWRGPKNPDNDGIFYYESAAGIGDLLQQGSMVSLRYTGKYLDGTIFDSNNLFPSQQPMTFQLGDKRLIPGFNMCIAKMKVGSKATFILPPRLAYNDGLTRIFEVEIVSVKTN